MNTAHLELLKLLRNKYLNASADIQTDMANAMETIVSTVFALPHLIGYELLQNADDADATSVDFILLDQYLMIVHNGASFSPTNVMGLCSYGARETMDKEELRVSASPLIQFLREIDPKGVEKKDDIHKIGYKGIGFKSVFSISNQVWIFSKSDFSFKFDLSYWESKGKLPWQLLPIEVENPPFDLASILQNPEEKVIFLLRLKEEPSTKQKKDLYGHLQKLFEKEHILLFLRNIERMRLIDYHNTEAYKLPTLEINRTRHNDLHYLERKKEGELKDHSRWLTKSYQIPAPKEAQAALSKSATINFPQKLQTVNQLEIAFAARFGKGDELVPQEETLVFSYLPTQKKYKKLPFYVNSNFLMNDNRTEFLPGNAWNKYLFEQIGYYQFKWFEELAQEEKYRMSVPGLIARYSDSAVDYNKSINIGSEKGASEAIFIPVLASQELKKANETIVDQTSISLESEDAKGMVVSSFEEERPLYIADPNLKHIKKIIDVGAKNFNKDRLKSALSRKNHFKTPAENQQLILFLHQKIHQIENKNDRDAWNLMLQDTPFLLNESGALREPPTLFFTPALNDLPTVQGVDFLHPKIYENLVNKQEKIRTWLTQLGTSPMETVEFIRKIILQMLDNKAIDEQNALVITRFLFQHSHHLGNKEWSALQHLPVFIKSGKGSAYLDSLAHTYLANDYDPELPLEKYVENQKYVDSCYLNDGDSKEKWKQFWANLGVNQRIEFTIHDQEINLKKLKELKDSIRQYWNWLISENQIPDHDKFGDQKLLNLVYQSQLPFTNDFQFAVNYWSLLLGKQWNNLRAILQKSTFRHKHGNKQIPSFFIHKVKTSPTFPATDGNCYPSTSLYAPSLEALAGNELKYAALSLTPEQETILGINRHLDQRYCFDLLNNIAAQEEVDKARIQKIYRYLLQNAYQQPEDIKELLLLAINNTFQPAAKLAYLDLPTSAQRKDSPHFIYLDLEPDEALNLCKLLGIRVYDEQDFQINEPTSGPSPFEQQLKEKQIFLAAIYAQRYHLEIQGAEIRIQELLQSVELRSADQLILQIQQDGLVLYEKNLLAWRLDTAIYHLLPAEDPRVRYSFVEVIAPLLQLEEDGKIIDLILQLDSNALREWMVENGYPLPKDQVLDLAIQSSPSVKIHKEFPHPSPTIGGQLQTTQIKATNTDAKIKAKSYLEKNNWKNIQTLDNGTLSAEHADYGNQYFIVLSAVGGTLFMGKGNWERLGKSNYHLLINYQSSGNELIMVSTQEELLQLDKNEYLQFVVKNNYQAAYLSELMNSSDEQAEPRIYVQLRAKTAIFEHIKSFDQLNQEEQMQRPSAQINQDDL